MHRNGANTERSAQEGNAVTVEIKSPEKMSGWLNRINLNLMASHLSPANLPFLMSAFMDSFGDIYQFEVLLPILKPQGILPKPRNYPLLCSSSTPDRCEKLQAVLWEALSILVPSLN